MAWIDTEINDLPLFTLEESVLGERGKLLSETELFVAGLIIHATRSLPVKQAAITDAARRSTGITLNARTVKDIVRTLRRTHGFPICSRKSQPAGYWWGRTEAEVEEWSNEATRQWKDEIITMNAVLKTNYPRLAGQLKLALEE